MNFLVLGTEGCLFKQALERCGHTATSVDKPVRFQVNSTLKKSTFDKCIVTQDVPNDLIDGIRRMKIEVWGASSWSYGLTIPEYQDGILSAIYDKRADSKIEPTFYLEGWWDGAQYSFCWFYMCQRRFMNDNVGPLTDGMWVIGRNLGPNSKLKVEILDPIVQILKRIEYRGPVQVGCYSDEGYVRVVSLKAQLCSIQFLAYSELLKDIGPAFVQGCRLQLRNQVTGASRVVSASVVSPLHGYRNEESPFLGKGVDEHSLRHTVIEQDATCKLSSQALVTARGIDEIEVRRRIMRTISLLCLNNECYRTDFGRGYQALVQELEGMRAL